jgi:hypothetical protein
VNAEPTQRVTVAPETSSCIQAAQDTLELEAKRMAAVGDPMAQALAAQSVMLGAMHRLFIDGTLQLAHHIEDGKRPIHPDEMRRAVVQGISGYAAGAVQRLGVRNLLIGTGLLLATLLVGAGGGYWFRGAVPVLVGVNAGAEKCDDRADGSRLCWIPVWERLPPTH